MSFLLFVLLFGAARCYGDPRLRQSPQTLSCPSKDRHSSTSCLRTLAVLKYCNDSTYQDYAKRSCPVTCGWCCDDGTMASGPFNQGCQGQQTRCQADRASQTTCLSLMTRGYCTKQGYHGYFMRINCPTTCGYCCADGTVATGPFKKGCKEERRCSGKDTLPVNVTGIKSCDDYGSNMLCWPATSKDWMKYYCESKCKWCCKDRNTVADGPMELRCAYKLCYNVHSDEYCQRKKNEHNSNFCDNAHNLAQCAWTCGICKTPHPSDSCNGRYGCCWDGTPATGPNNQGCRWCRDRSQHVCNQFKHGCITGQYRLRSYMDQNCPETCKHCPAVQSQAIKIRRSPDGIFAEET